MSTSKVVRQTNFGAYKYNLIPILHESLIKL